MRNVGPLAKSVLEELAKPGVVEAVKPVGLILPRNKVFHTEGLVLIPRNACVDLVIKAKWEEVRLNLDQVVEFIKQEEKQQAEQQQQQQQLK